ncbi:MAG TPA: pyridoxamine 5'-phosphate oxidase family protein [Methanocorpusculum sp.]|nr:pyridoxamine 5'-phosphate oxidase family protein [Methanocorpusculum sp.]
MFREMRRKAQALSSEICEEILSKNTAGVLSLSGDDGYPYGVPLSYCYEKGKLIFHCAKTGHKIDSVRRSSKASFCVIDKDEIRAEEYTTYFRSVIVFGEIRIVNDADEKRKLLDFLAKKYNPNDTDEHRSKVIERESAAVCILEMTAEHLSGKEAIELTRMHKNQ